MYIQRRESDEIMPDLEDIETRLRVVENAVIELAMTGKFVKGIAVLIALSFGIDITGGI